LANWSGSSSWPVLEGLAVRRRRHADLTRRHLFVLLLQRLDHVLGIQAAHLQLVGIEPDAHRILAGAEHQDVADAGQARNLVLELDGRVVAQVEAVVAGVGRGQRHDLQDRGRLLLHGDALRLHRLRQRRQRGRHAVLHQHLREIEIGADLERHRQGVAAVGAGVGLHVDHAFHAVHLLLDRQRHGVDHRAGARTRVARRDLHGRRHDFGILRDRQREQGDAADHQHQDRQDVGENRPLDEEFRDHGVREQGSEIRDQWRSAHCMRSPSDN